MQILTDFLLSFVILRLFHEGHAEPQMVFGYRGVQLQCLPIFRLFFFQGLGVGASGGKSEPAQTMHLGAFHVVGGELHRFVGSVQGVFFLTQACQRLGQTEVTSEARFMLNLVRFAEGFLRAVVVMSHESFLSRFQFLLRNGIELRLCLLRAAGPANECCRDQSTGSHKPKHAVSGGSPKGCVHIGWNYATRLIEFMNTTFQ